MAVLKIHATYYEVFLPPVGAGEKTIVEGPFATNDDARRVQKWHNERLHPDARMAWDVRQVTIRVPEDVNVYLVEKEQVRRKEALAKLSYQDRIALGLENV